MKHSFRKGLESPCKIRGFLSTDYWILVAALSGAFILFILGLRSGIMVGNWSTCIMTIICSIVLFPILIRKFRKNAKSKKFDEIKKEYTISNFQLSHTIRKMRTEEAYSILDIINEENGVILTKGGNICISYQLEEPECYSLSREDIDQRYSLMKEAFKFLPDGCFVHKQDLYLRKNYHAVPLNWSFLDIADAKHFEGRLYMQHLCIIHFVLTGLNSLDKAYISSPLAYKENLHKEDLEKLSDFLEAINNCVSIIKNLRDTRIAPIKGEDLKTIYQDTLTYFLTQMQLQTYMLTMSYM